MTTSIPTSNSASSSAPPDVLAIAVSDRLRAQELLLAVTRLGSRGSVALSDAALVGLNPHGKARITQTREMSPGMSAMFGAWWGSLIGLILFGYLGWLGGATLGAGLGWWRARRKDVGVPNDWMLGLAGLLNPGEVVDVFQMRDVYPTHLIRELRRFNGRLITDTVVDADPTEVADALAYTV